MTGSMNWKSRWPMCRRPDVEAPLWLVDRLFRHILVDITGNTHRAEICIDKLYSPDGADRPARAGRIPRARNAARSAHVAGAAIADPRADRKALARAAAGQVRALGHDAARSLHAAAFPLGGFSRTCSPSSKQSGYDFSPDWYAAQLEFRFPVFGRVHHGGVALELRQALEPWHVLGEEGSAGGTVRYVDSSVERLQVKADGLRRGPPCRHLQRPADADDGNRPLRRGGRRASASRPGSRPRGCIRPSRSTRR